MSDPGSDRSADGSAARSGPGSGKDRRRAVLRAIRRRQEPPPGLEELAMQVALRQSALRWFVVLYAVGFLLFLPDLVLGESADVRIRGGALALLFLLGGILQWRVGQRARDAVTRWSPLFDGLGRYRPDGGPAS